MSYIDPLKCVLCRKCVPVCPTNAIWEVNLPPKKAKPAEEPEKKPAAKKEIDLVKTAKENISENKDIDNKENKTD